jgi:autotransporter-associated beta strand protein
LKKYFLNFLSGIFVLVVLILFYFSTGVLFAQSVADVTTNAGDESVNSLGWAVTTLNASGDGTIDINNGSLPITLSQPLSVISINLTLQGQDLNLIGQNSSQTQLSFQQSFNQQGNLTLQNEGGPGTALDASVAALSWVMTSNVFANISGAAAGNTVVTGGSGVIGQAGGNASVTAAFWTAQDSAILTAGAGGSVTDTNGTGDVGGTGGAVKLVGTSLTFSGSQMVLTAGSGGSATDLGSGAPTGGTGGAASLSYGSMSLEFGNFSLTGGGGGSGVTGGAGGQSSAILGSLSISGGSQFAAQGGLGGNGVSFGGAGGDASVSFGSLSVSSGLVNISGGAAGSSNLSGGNGGDAFVAGGGLTISSAIFDVTGGNGGGSLGPASGGPANGGNGGNAGVSVASLSIATGSSFNLISGNGGNGGTGSSPGAGGQGGNTFLDIGTYSINSSTSFTSGTGGSGENSTTGAAGGLGGTGGSLAVTFGNLTLNSAANLQLNAGNGGTGGNALSGGNGGAGGNGGNVSFGAASVSLIGTSSTSLVIEGGGGGSGGSGAASGSNGIEGQASVSIGDLEGLGSLEVNGSTALLQISSGSFSGDISGDETLQKTGSGSLVLSGSNSYSGGTSILGGSLSVDTGGVLGTGSVYNNSTLDFIDGATAGSISITNGHFLNFNQNASAGHAVINNNDSLFFDNNSTAASSTIANNTGSVLQFNDFSTAGNAVITSMGDGGVWFYGHSSGGTAQFVFIQNAGVNGILDISEASSPVTVGSVSGAGYFYLGSNHLAIGSNNLSTTFTGPIVDGGLAGGSGGSLVKIGTGTLTLTSTATYSGGTDIAAGTLAVGNSQALGLGSVSVNGGTLSTAGFPLVFQVGGNYIQSSAGTLQLGLSGSVTSTSDKMGVTGTASLNGTLNLVSYGGLTAPPLGSFTQILEAASVNGIFQQVNENFTGMRFLPVYFPGAVDLESINTSFQNFGLTPNQKAIGADLDANFLKPQLNSFISNIGVLSGPALQSAYSQLSPEDFTALYQAGFEGALSRAALVNDRLYQLKAEVDQMVTLPGFSRSGSPLFAGNLQPYQEAAMVPLSQEGTWSGFVSGNGGFFNVAPDGNAAGYKASTYGLTGAGADYRLSKHAAIGLLAGYGHTAVTLDQGGTLSADGGQLGLYGLYSSEGFYADALVEGGLNQYNTLRSAYGGTASGTTQGQEMSGALEMGYGWKQGQVSVGPIGSVQFTQVNINGFSEQGSLSPLTIPSQKENSLVSQLGIRADGEWKWGQTSLNPMMSLAWEHECDYQGGTLQAGFGTGDSFTVEGPQIGQNGILAGAGLSIGFSKEFGVSLNYQGELGRANLVSNLFGGGIQLGF